MPSFCALHYPWLTISFEHCVFILGIGETPFGDDIQKRTKFGRRRSWKPLQVSITKTPLTPITPRSEQGKQARMVFNALVIPLFLLFSLPHNNRRGELNIYFQT